MRRAASVSAVERAARPRPRAARDAGRPRRRRCAGARSARVDVRRGRLRALRGRRDRGSRADARPPPLDGDVEELDGRGLCAIPGLVDCHTHACFARRPRRGVRAARGAARRYEELHAAGGGILSTVRATRAAGEAGSRAAVERHAGWMLRAGHDDVRGASPATGSTATPSSRRCARSAPPAASRPGSARTPCRRSSTTRTPTSTSRSPRCCPRRRELAEAADVFLERGAFDVDAGAPLPDGLPRRRARAPPARRPVHGVGARSRSRSSSARARSTTSRRPAERASRALAASDVVGVLLPASALFLGRPMPPARALVDAGAAVALATDFNPGSAFCESLPLVCSLACTQLDLSPAEALAACTVNAAHVLGLRRPARAGSRRATTPTSSCSTRPTGATSPTTSAATWSSAVIRRGAVAWARYPARLARCRREAAAPAGEGPPARVRVRLRRRRGPARSRSTRTRSRREPRSERQAARRRRRRQDAARKRVRESSRRRGAASLKRGAIFAPLMLRRLLGLNQRISGASTALAAHGVYTGFFVPFMYLMDRAHVPLVPASAPASEAPQRGRSARDRDSRVPCARTRHSPSTATSSARSGRTATSSRGLAARPRRSSSTRAATRPSSGSSSRGWARRVAAILLTHTHWDHLGGVADLAEGTGAPVYMAEDERALLENLPDLYPNGVSAAPTPPDILAPGRRDDRARRDRVRGVHVPGPLAGHLAYYADGCLFSGDVLFAGSVGRTDLPGADWDTLIASIRAARRALPARDDRLLRPRPADDARRRARAQPVPRRAPRL